MANINGIIQRDKPVDVAGDIYKVLGLAPRLIAGTNLVCYPISYAAGNAHGKINKWSKIKPVEIEDGIATRISKDTLSYVPNANNMPDGMITGFTDNVPAYIGRVFSEQRTVGGVTFNLFHFFGMTVPWDRVGVNPANDHLAKTMRTLILNANAQHVNWEYQNVSGGIKAPFRVLDFEGYCHTAVCPISYQTQDVYNNGKAVFSCFRNPEDYDAQIDLTELDRLFKDFKIYVSYFKKNDATPQGNDAVLEIGDLKDNRDTTVTTSGSLGSVSASGRDMEAYFFAGSKKTGIFITLPSLPDYPNPMPFRHNSGNSPDTPIKQLTWKEFGFALARDNPFFESFDNVNEGLYTVLFSPQGFACIRARVQNNTGSAQNIELAKVTVTADNRDLGRVIYKQPISGGTMTIQNGTYLTLAQGEECYLYFDIIGNLFDRTGVTKAESASKALENENREKHRLLTYIEIRYSSIVELSNELEAYYSPLNDGKHFYAQPPIDKWYNSRDGNKYD